MTKIIRVNFKIFYVYFYQFSLHKILCIFDLGIPFFSILWYNIGV